jgi:hypothetical protein
VSVCNGQPDHISNIVWWSHQIRQIWAENSSSAFIGQYDSISNIIWVVLSDTNQIFTQGKHWLARHGIKYYQGDIVGLGRYQWHIYLV